MVQTSRKWNDALDGIALSGTQHNNDWDYKPVAAVLETEKGILVPLEHVEGDKDRA
jgi:hypothetical protein